MDTNNLIEQARDGDVLAIDTVCNRLEAAEKLVEQLQKDADRYRWLVDNSFDREVTQLHVWKHTWEPHSKTGEPTEWKCRVRGPAIDSVVDEALAAAKAFKDGV